MPMTIDDLLAKFATLYQPHAKDPQRFVAEYREALSGWSGELIERAWPVIRDTHDRTDRWPTIAACKRALNQVAADVPRAQPRPDDNGLWRRPTPAERVRVRELLVDLKKHMAMHALPDPEGAPQPRVDRTAFEPRMRRYWDDQWRSEE